MERKAIIALCVGLLFGGGALALNPSLDVNQYAHTSWKVGAGLFEGAIQTIAQTPDGYLWIGTELGLLRFDGVRTTPWQAPAGERLPSTNISKLLVAKDGRLWIGTALGLASWKDGRLVHYPELAGQIISALLEDRAGLVWTGGIGVPTGRLCAIQSGAVQCFGQDGSLAKGVLSLYEENGNLWAGAGTGLWRWKPGPPKRYALPRGGINDVIKVDGGSLLILTLGGVRQLVGDNSEPYPLPGARQPFQATRVLRDRGGALWIGTFDRGLLHLHQGRTDLFTPSEGLSGHQVIALFEDREGSVWVGTREGLDRFRDFAVPALSGKQGLPTEQPFSALAAGDGSIWLGGVGGLTRWKNGEFTIYRKRDGLPGENAHSLFEDGRGRIWVSTLGGIAYFEDGRFVPVRSVLSRVVYNIAEGPAGNFWINDQDRGLIHLLDDRVVQQIPWAALGHQDHSTSLTPDPRRGGIWLGFYQGGVLFFQDGQIRESYGIDQGLGAGRVWELQLPSDGSLWAATDGGLSRIKDNRVATLNNRNGLPCDSVYWVIEDDEHSVWLYMSCGLARISRAELDAWAEDPTRAVTNTVFGASDGVKIQTSTSGLSPQAAKLPDGRIWFATHTGVSVIDPRHLGLNNLPPPVQIEQIIADHKVRWQNVSGGLASNPRLPALTRDLQIDYTALSFVARDKIRFKYKLEGYDPDWQDAGNRRQGFYTNLGPQKYRFRVKACNNSGVWNEEGAFLDFAVEPAFYQTGWFRLLGVAAAAALLWGAYRIRIGVLQRRQRLLERHQAEITALNERLMKAQEEERTRIAGELHDGVIQQVTTAALKLGAVKFQVPPDSPAKAEIAGVQNQLMQIGTDIRHLSHELHPSVLQESGLPEALSSYCAEFSKARGISVTCEVDSDVKELSRGSALALYRIAQEALGNVAKHSKAKQVHVRLVRADGRVRLTVSDDGTGFVPGRAGDSGGVGLVNMRERLRHLSGMLELESQLGRGTTIRAEVPFRPA